MEQRKRDREERAFFFDIDAVDVFQKKKLNLVLHHFHFHTLSRPAHDPGRLPALPALPRLGDLDLEGTGEQGRARRPGGGDGCRDLHGLQLDQAGERRRRGARGVQGKARRGAAGIALGGARCGCCSCCGERGGSSRRRRKGSGSSFSLFVVFSSATSGDAPSEEERPLLLDLPREALEGGPQAPRPPRQALVAADPLHRRRVADRRAGRGVGPAARGRGRRRKRRRRRRRKRRTRRREEDKEQEAGGRGGHGHALLDVRLPGPHPPARLPGQRAPSLPEGRAGDGAGGGGV